MIDEYSGNEIRKTDNGIKEGDKVSPQTPELLELDENGVPVGFEEWEVHGGDR